MIAATAARASLEGNQLDRGPSLSYGGSIWVNSR